jgi:NADH dehydrogenase/NADH:ubiquinone oxidoreductase subunit G
MQLQEQGQLLQQLTQALDGKTRELDTEAVKEQAVTLREQQRLAADAQREQADLQARMDIERMKNETQLAIAQMKIQADDAKAVFHATTKRVGTESQWQYDEEMKAQQQRADKELTMLKGALKAAPAADTTVAVVSTPEEDGPPGYGPGV